MVSNDWERVVKRYFSSIKPAKGPFTLYLRYAEEKAVLSLLGKNTGQRILDVSSEPRLFLKLEKNGFDISRLDFTETYRDYIHQKTTPKKYYFDKKFINTGKMKVPEKFDFIFSVGTFNYFPDPKKLMAFMHDKLDAGGSVICSIKMKAHPDSLIADRHSRTFSVYDVADLLDGFSIDKVLPVAKDVPKTKGLGNLILQPLTPAILLNDVVAQTHTLLNRENAWYYIIKAKKK
ncbi:MAG: class I SAM-dependent methyltransferase [Nanoarchaeota archaeon]|nr:class I SAM-dependent methyltransferase [Nanoarchaeota archaeon]